VHAQPDVQPHRRPARGQRDDALQRRLALQASLANALGVPVGRYTHHAVSLHLYERDLPKLEQLHRHDGSYLEHNGGFRFSRLVEQEAFDHEHLKLFGLTLTSWPDITSMPGLENLPVERWYREQLVAP
jgi:hypothetical protein